MVACIYSFTAGHTKIKGKKKKPRKKTSNSTVERKRKEKTKHKAALSRNNLPSNVVAVGQSSQNGSPIKSECDASYYGVRTRCSWLDIPQRFSPIGGRMSTANGPKHCKPSISSSSPSAGSDPAQSVSATISWSPIIQLLKY